MNFQCRDVFYEGRHAHLITDLDCLLSGTGDMIRTCNLLLPKQLLYQVELHP